MTRRQRLEKVIELEELLAQVEGGSELVADCEVELSKLNERSARANEEAKSTAHSLKNRELEGEILGLAKGTMAEEMAKELGLSRQKVTSLCTNLVREGKLKVEDVKVKGKGIRKIYTTI